MSTVTATLKVQADGTIHLPVPASLRSGRLQVTATLQPLESNELSVNLRLRGDAFRKLRKLDIFRDIQDPVAWQKEIRKDRTLISESQNASGQ